MDLENYKSAIILHQYIFLQVSAEEKIASIAQSIEVSELKVQRTIKQYLE